MIVEPARGARRRRRRLRGRKRPGTMSVRAIRTSAASRLPWTVAQSAMRSTRRGSIARLHGAKERLRLVAVLLDPLGVEFVMKFLVHSSSSSARGPLARGRPSARGGQLARLSLAALVAAGEKRGEPRGPDRRWPWCCSVRPLPTAGAPTLVPAPARAAVNPHHQHREQNRKNKARAMAMQHIPREQTRAEGAAQAHEYCHGDPHGVRTGQQQPRQRADEQTTEEQDEKVDEKSHACTVPSLVPLLFAQSATEDGLGAGMRHIC